MTRTATTLTAIVVVLILAGGFWLFMQPVTDQQNNEPATATSTEAIAEVRTVVTNFGNKLKNVSLLSTSTVVTDLGLQYGPYLSSDLLAAWQADPSNALGRMTSSPWPDRIDITSVTQSGVNEYTVEGRVVEVTSADTASTTANGYPVTLKLTQVNGTWIITSVTRTP